MSDLPEGMTDADSYRIIVEAVREFAGHQVIGFGKAWTVCTGLTSDDVMPEEARYLQWILEELGYERQWVSEGGQASMQHMWVRGPWPIDCGANRTRVLTPYVSMS